MVHGIQLLPPDDCEGPTVFCAAPTGVPHSLQKRAPALSGAEQDRQRASPRAAPHWLQNLPLAEAPQAWQVEGREVMAVEIMVPADPGQGGITEFYVRRSPIDTIRLPA